MGKRFGAVELVVDTTTVDDGKHVAIFVMNVVRVQKHGTGLRNVLSPIAFTLV